MNALFTISPYKEQGVWMFDDASRNIKKEPFVAGADTLLDKVSGGQQRLTAIFSPTKFPGHNLEINKLEGDKNGTFYYCEEHKQELWLCPALFAYLDPAPQQLFIQIKKDEIQEG